MTMSRRSASQPVSARLRQWRILLSLFFCLALALRPEPRRGARRRLVFGGGGSSFGSRGLRSFENNGASPLSRSMAPTPPAASPLAGAYGGSFFQRHPFLTGLFGGFLGSMLFHGLGGFGHVLGGLLTLLIIGGLIFVRHSAVLRARLLHGRGRAAGCRARSARRPRRRRAIAVTTPPSPRATSTPSRRSMPRSRRPGAGRSRPHAPADDARDARAISPRS